MKYVILQCFLMVHLCNIKVFARHKSKSVNYEKDHSVSELAEAARNDHEVKNRPGRTQKRHEGQSSSDDEIEKQAKIIKELADKIDVEGILNEMISLSKTLNDNPTKKAVGKYGKTDWESGLEDDAKHLSKKSKTTEFKTKERSSKHKRTDKHHSKKKTLGENKRSRGDMADDSRKEDPNGQSKTSLKSHSSTHGKRHENSDKNHHSLEGQVSNQEDKKSRVSQNSQPKKGTIKEEESHKVKGIKEKEILSSMSIEKAKTEEVIEKHSAEENNKGKISSDDKTHGGVKNSRSFEDSIESGSQEQTPKDQMTKEHTDENPDKLVIRKEAGKLYTYVKDPAYDDYHEKLGNWRKKHPENPADFLK